MYVCTSEKALSYVYKCTHTITQEFYFGYRCANVSLRRPSHADFPEYKTSFDRIKNNFDEFEWTIIAEFFTADSAYDREQYLIYENWENPLMMNSSCFYKKKRFKSTPLSEHHKKQISIAQSKPKSTSHKQNLAAALKGRHWFNDGIRSVQAKECPPGFTSGRIIDNHGEKNPRYGASNKFTKLTIIICDRCGKSGAGGAMIRNHFNNCTSHIIYKFIHKKTQEKISVTFDEFIEKYLENKKITSLRSCINGYNASINGWIIQREKRNELH